MRRSRVLSVFMVLGLGVAAAACGSSGGSDAASTTTAAATTTKPTATAAYEGWGPHEVGSRDIALADGRRVWVLYPAAASAKDQPKEIFDIASLLSPELQSKLTPDQRPKETVNAHPGAQPATDGPFPVVLYSHGFGGYPELGADMETHMASWGFVVVAPDHVERSADGLLGTAGKAITKKLTDHEVLEQALDAALADAKVTTSPLHGLLDPSELAVTGESAGAAAAYELAGTDPRIKAFISYSLGFGGAPGQPVPTYAVPKVPGLVMAGSRDGVIPAATSKEIFAGMQSPKWFVEVAGVGHSAFTDACTIGKESGGLVAIIQAAGLNIPDTFIRLLNDGCAKGYVDPPVIFPAVDHFTVAFLRAELGVDAKPIGLDQATADTLLPAKVTVTAAP